VTDLHNGVLFHHKENQNYSVCRKSMELEIIMLSEISQIQKDKYHIFLSYMESRSEKTTTKGYEHTRGLLTGSGREGDRG
jgi:hypothetical protein